MPDTNEPDHEIFPKQFAVNELIQLETDLCIVCPHTRADHYEKGDYFSQCWCRECNKDEMAGPCSYYFVARHKFKPKVIVTTDCIICKLGSDSMAHQL